MPSILTTPDKMTSQELFEESGFKEQQPIFILDVNIGSKENKVIPLEIFKNEDPITVVTTF